MTLYLSNRDGNGKTSEEGHYKFQTAVWKGQVLGATALLVKQNSPLAMSVLVSIGQFKIDTPENYSYTGWNTTDTAVAVSTADPANPRISTIVAYVDRAASTSPSPPNNPGIVKLKSVNGSAGALPTAPNDATIQASVGTGNPFIRLANITVPAAASNIINSYITDLRQLIGLSDEVIMGSNIELKSNPAAYPIGSIYINASVATNPATLLGFGTWVSFGAGRVMVGLDSGDTAFDTLEETGGAKTHTLISNEMPQHAHNVYGVFVERNGSGVSLVQQGDANLVRYGAGAAGWPGGAVGTTGSQRLWGIGNPTYGMNTDNTGANAPHNNLQPYIVVYMWKRTA